MLFYGNKKVRVAYGKRFTLIFSQTRGCQFFSLINLNGFGSSVDFRQMIR